VRRRRLPLVPWADVTTEQGETSRARCRPWHVRLRQGLAGAGIATLVVGGGMSALLVRQRAVQGATALAAPPARCAVQPPVTPSCLVTPALMANAPPAPAMHASTMPPQAPPSSSAIDRRRSKYAPTRP